LIRAMLASLRVPGSSLRRPALAIRHPAERTSPGPAGRPVGACARCPASPSSIRASSAVPSASGTAGACADTGPRLRLSLGDYVTGMRPRGGRPLPERGNVARVPVAGSARRCADPAGPLAARRRRCVHMEHAAQPGDGRARLLLVCSGSSGFPGASVRVWKTMSRGWRPRGRGRRRRACVLAQGEELERRLATDLVDQGRGDSRRGQTDLELRMAKDRVVRGNRDAGAPLCGVRAARQAPRPRGPDAV